MAKVNNRQAMWLLTKRTLQQNRWRNVIAVCAIVLTSVLFTGFFAVAGGLVDQFNQSGYRLRGSNAMAGIKYLSESQYEAVKATGKYKSLNCTRLVGGTQDEALRKLNGEVRWGEDAAAEYAFSLPTTGRMPQNENEVAVSTLVLDALGIAHEIGAEVPLNIGVDEGENGIKTHTKTFVLSGYWQGDKLAPAQQVWLSRMYADKIAPAAKLPLAETGSYTGLYMAEIEFGNRLLMGQKMQDLLQAAGLVEETTSYYYDTQNNSGGGAPDFATVASIGLFLAFVLLSGYLIIYNIFYISVVQDIRLYGLLKTVGTSGKQLAKLVRMQAMALSAVGIPLGLAGGTFVGVGLLPHIQASFFTIERSARYNIPWYMLVGAAAFSLLTVSISCIRPSRFVAKLSPIEASKFAGPKQKKLKKTQNAAKGRATPFGMAGANRRRTKGKFALVVLSLALSLTLLNITYTAITGFDLEKYVEENTFNDFLVSHYSIDIPGREKITNGIPADFEQQVQGLEGLERYDTIHFEQKRQPMDIPQWQALIQYYETALQTDPSVETNLNHYKETNGFDYLMYGVNPAQAQLMQPEEGAFDAEKWATGNYVMVEPIWSYSGSMNELNLYKPGDVLTLYDAAGTPHEYTVMGVGGLPAKLTIQQWTSDTVQLVLPESEREKLFGPSDSMLALFDVNEEGEAAAEAFMKQYITENDNLVYTSRSTFEQEFEKDKRTFLFIGGALSALLGLIGILNFAGTTITSILARRNELAMLAAVGMSGKQIKAMLVWESMAYVGGGAALAASLGSLAGWFVGKNLLRFYWAFTWRFTLVPIGMALPFLLAAGVLIPLGYYRLVCRQTIVQRLRKAA